MAGAGLISLFFKDLRWKLDSVDDSFSLTGQFTSTDLVENISANYAEFRSLGRAQPILMFEDNANDTMTFGVRFWAQHNGLFGFGILSDKIDDKVSQLRSLPRPVASLGRPRIFDFSLGESISMRCVVAGVGGISYDRARPMTGDLRGVTTSITLKRFEEYDVSVAGRAAESLVQPFLADDSYEIMAQKFYGEPVLGEALRRRNPELPLPRAGTFIHLPPKQSLANGFALTPQSPVLKKSDATDALRNEAFRRQAQRKKLVYTLGPEWNKVA
jgi:hypothetical protein